MVVELALAAQALTLGGAYWLLSRSRRNTPKNRCPWYPCGFPLPDSGLVSRMRDTLFPADFAPEKCPGCDHWVRWCPFNATYIRWNG